MRDKNKCEIKKESGRFCKGEYAINYLGKKLCDECWDKIAKPKEATDGTGD